MGKDQYPVIFLTADHGVAEVASHMEAEKGFLQQSEMWLYHRQLKGLYVRTFG